MQLPSQALVVDDSRAIRSILSKILISNGFSVCQAADGREALLALDGAARNLSLLCVDYNMPHMNGVELVRAMRADPRFAHTPVVMITTETDLVSMEHAFHAGVNEYVMKPFTADMVVDKLRLLGALAS